MCPITLDLNGNGLKLSGLQPPSSFDLDGDGSPDYSSWTRFQTKDGFLVLDRDGSGLIDDGRELFGNATPLLLRAGIALHGYEALAEFDDLLLGGNANGEIDAGDRIFEHLRVWLDTNRDNVSQPEELLTLVEADLESLSLAFYFDGSVDQWGNELRWKSQINFSDGGSSEATDVFFKRQEARGGSNSTASGSGGSGQQD